MGGGGWRYPTPARPTPVPTQERALDTVRAAIEATVELLERDPEPRVTLEAIRRRSGVSQGSLTHHFGGRDGLIAAANVERYERSCAADEGFLRQLDGVLTGPETTVPTLLGMLDAMLGEDRRTGRWIRLSAIAATFADEDLTATLSRTYTRLTDGLTAVVAQARASGMLRDGTDPRTTALLLTMQAQGLVLDDVMGMDVERSSWNHMQARFASVFVTPEVGALLVAESDARFGDLWRAEVYRRSQEPPHAVAERLAAVRRRAGHAQHGPDHHPPVDASAVEDLIEAASLRAPTPDRVRPTGATEPREQLLEAAVATLREHGQRGIDVARLRREVDVSPQSFHRMFGTREGLVREARIRLEVLRSSRAVALFAGLIAASERPADLRAAFVHGAIRISSGGALRAMWQRIETIAASYTDPELCDELARVQRVARDLVIEQVCLAQRRGLIDPTLPPTGVARLLEGSMFWHVFHALDSRRPDLATWTTMLERVADLISPDH